MPPMEKANPQNCGPKPWEVCNAIILNNTFVILAFYSRTHKHTHTLRIIIIFHRRSSHPVLAIKSPITNVLPSAVASSVCPPAVRRRGSRKCENSVPASTKYYIHGWTSVYVQMIIILWSCIGWCITIQPIILSLKRDFFIIKIVFHYKYEKAPILHVWHTMDMCMGTRAYIHVHVYIDQSLHILCAI